MLSDKKALALLAYLTTLPIAVVGAPMENVLTKPHKSRTMHMQLCIPDVDIVQCDKDENGNDKADIMYMDGNRMFMWEEYQVAKSDTDRATAMWSPIMETPIMKPALPTAGMTNSNDMSMWKAGGTVTENDVAYNRYVLKYEEVTAGNQEAEKQKQVVDSGLLPDRWEYLEKVDGTPYVIRQYSGRNRNTMYEETKFMMAQELTDTEIADGTMDLAIEMANDAANRRRKMLRRTTKGHRRTQLETSVDGFFQLEFPPNCLEGDNDQCLGVFLSGNDSGEQTYRVDAVLREPNGGRSAELYGEVVVGPDGELLFVQGAARGCTSPGSVKVGNLAGIELTACLGGGVSWNQGEISGKLELSAQAKAEVARIENTIELAGFIEVMAETIDGETRFTGFEGGISVEVGAETIALALEATVDASPNDVQNGDDWVTRVYLSPSVEYNFFLFSGSASYTFRIAQIGPRRLESTSTPRRPRTPLPEIVRLRSSGIASTQISSSYPLTIWVEERGSITNQIVRGFQVEQRGNRDGSSVYEITGIRLVYRDGETVLGGSDPSFRVRNNQVDLDEDEYIVRVAGFWYFNDIRQLVIDTNKGRTFEYKSDSTFFQSSRPNTNFNFMAEDGEALYTFDAQVSTLYDYRPLEDIAALWGEAPEQPCPQEVLEQGEQCISREADVAIDSNPLQCTGWPATSGYTNNRERCVLANDQINDGFLYVYNEHRFSDNVEPECGSGAVCWCCRRRE